MKRFYKQATTSLRHSDAAGDAEGIGHEILLDGRPVRTPARQPLLVPSRALAEAISEEWNAQGETIDPRSMPLTGLANAAIDRVAPDPAAFAAMLAAYGESDLLCYRADAPAALCERQAAGWDPILGWARGRYDTDFEIAAGVMHRPQPASTIERLGRAAAARSPFELAALSPLVTISGSLLIALAVAEREIGIDEAWAAATVDEAWQAEKWGEDAEASARLEARRREFEAADLFLDLLRRS